MEHFLNYLISQLVENKDQLSIEKKEDQGIIYFTVTVASSDMGRIIGKDGKIINSIRNLLKILAVKEKQRVVLQLSEPQS